MSKPGSKYFPLYERLQSAASERIALSFRQIEAALGRTLPASARAQRAWWGNRQGGLQARAWLAAGYQVAEIDLEKERVTFEKPQFRYQIRRQGDIILWDAAMIKALRNYLGLTQGQLAKELGVRQQTVSEWETETYRPRRAMSKLLGLVAEQAGFYLETEND